RILLGVGYALTVAFRENDLGRYAVHSNAVRTRLGGDDLSEDLDARLSSGIGDRCLRMWPPADDFMMMLPTLLSLTAPAVRDILWTLTSYEIHRCLVVEREWNAARY